MAVVVTEIKDRTMLGLSGKSGAGKDTVADILVSKWGFSKFTVATPLKEACRIIFGFSDEQLNGNLRNVVDLRWGITPRRALQVVGTDLFRVALAAALPEIGDNIWVMVLRNRINECHNNKIVITDIRYQNELDVLGPSAQSWRIIRPEYELTGAAAQHPSEAGNFKVDINVNNNGTLEDLEREVDSLVKNYIL
jgi:hypothetical protein